MTTQKKPIFCEHCGGEITKCSYCPEEFEIGQNIICHGLESKHFCDTECLMQSFEMSESEVVETGDEIQ